MTPPTAETGLRLTVYVRESARWHHRPAYAEIVHRAHAAGLAGAGVFRGIEGYGRGGRVHTTRLLDLAEDLPVAVVVVDEEALVRAFVPSVREVLGEDNGLITLEPVEIVP
ncbi:PII-like signaling protein [Streptacidiphilus sp. MAP12-33]|uniref:DUF190 domain-containing protein n=1 Tax=Streptacidiphilus sp. MAP12-33 TaxID=3156266 RepID=UPI00351308FF